MVSFKNCCKLLTGVITSDKAHVFHADVRYGETALLEMMLDANRARAFATNADLGAVPALGHVGQRRWLGTRGVHAGVSELREIRIVNLQRRVYHRPTRGGNPEIFSARVLSDVIETLSKKNVTIPAIISWAGNVSEDTLTLETSTSRDQLLR